MKMLSKTFRSLLESMKSPYNEMDEDRDERVERREERRKERREDKFGVSTDTTSGVTAETQGNTDFKIRPFIKAVDQLKSQVQSEIFNIKQTLDNREAGYQSAKTYELKFAKIAEIISKITSRLDLIKSRKEGGNLETGTEKDPKDLAEIKLLRGLYSTASNDFLAAQKEWKEKKLEDENKYLSDLKDTDTNNFIFGANKAFDQAQAMLNELIRISQLTVNNKKGVDGSKGTENLAAGNIIKSGKYTKDSKEGKIVIEVKKTIYNKFKKYLGKTKDWGIVYKSGVDNVSGTLLDNTQNVIKGVKAGLGDDYPELKSDKTGDITPAFINIINKVSESKNNTSGRLITFENFIKSKITEGFNQSAAEVAMSGGGSSNNSGSNNSKKPKVATQEYSATPFVDVAEGNKFRAWVNKTHKEWAKTNNLSEEGPRDNTYIRKAYSEFEKDYAKLTKVVTVAKVTNSQLQQIVKSIKASGANTELRVNPKDDSNLIFWWKGKEYATMFNNFRLSFTSSSGKKFNASYDIKGNINFDNGKTITLKDFVSGNASFKISGEKPEVAQSKKAFVSSSGEGFTNVRSSAMANTGTVNNLLYKHTNKTSQIGVVVSSQVVKSSKIGDKTWYKVQFPTKMSGKEFGYVRSDTVDLK